MKRLDRSARGGPARSAAGRAGLAPPEEAVLQITEVGARGDGLAQGPNGPVYVPFALPGEEVLARRTGDRAEIARILEESPERITPACPAFGRCGGCQLQHWAPAPYLAWKQAAVIQALAKRGLETEVLPIIEAWGEGRRRAGLHAVRQGRELRFGFIARGGAGVEPIPACPLLAPRLRDALPALRRLALALAPERGEVVLQCLLTPEGIDADVKGVGAPEAQRHRLPAIIQAAFDADLARLSLEGEPVVSPREPRLRIGRALVKPAPGAFVQPTEAGEETLARLVLEGVGEARRFADLFCGMGAFALRLAERGEVLAVEGEEAMLAALKAGADGAAGALGAVTTLRRDLLRTPLSALELKRVEAVVLDPPRSGARLQAEQIAASKASRVVSVSCDPASFARDAKALVDGGFQLLKVTPVDQFRWSPHVELVGVFVR